MWPRCIHHDLFFLDTHLIWSALLHDWQRAENILLDHFHHSIKMRDNQIDDVMLVCEKVAKFRNVLESLILLSDHLVVVVEVENLTAELNLLQEMFLAF